MASKMKTLSWRSPITQTAVQNCADTTLYLFEQIIKVDPLIDEPKRIAATFNLDRLTGNWEGLQIDYCAEYPNWDGWNRIASYSPTRLNAIAILKLIFPDFEAGVDVVFPHGNNLGTHWFFKRKLMFDEVTAHEKMQAQVAIAEWFDSPFILLTEDV